MRVGCEPLPNSIILGDLGNLFAKRMAHDSEVSITHGDYHFFHTTVACS